MKRWRSLWIVAISMLTAFGGNAPAQFAHQPLDSDFTGEPPTIYNAAIDSFDFVVKLIDVYSDEYKSQAELGGYQLMISADILRGRYHKDFMHPSPIPAGQVERYRWVLPTAKHVFLPGHKIMVQIQSSWFPLYDRNPQTYVENIFWAKPEDFCKATQRIYRTGARASSIELPIVE